MLHLGDREGKRDGDCERETLGHSHNNDSDSNDEAVSDLLPEVDSEAASILVSAFSDDTLDDDGDEGEDGDGQTELANAFSDAVKLLLEGGLVSLDVHREASLALVGVVTDGENDSSSLALADLRALNHKRVSSGVFFADGLLLEFVRLTCQR